MTTAAQVKKLVKPLLERHSDLALVGRWIFVKPVHHFARAILIDRMLDPAKFRPRWAVAHLFEWRHFFPLDWGDMIDNENASRPMWWYVTEPDIGQVLVQAIEDNALPVLRAMATLQDYLACVSNHYFRHHLYDWPSCRIIVETALGDLESARATAKANLAVWSRNEPHFDEETRQQYGRLRALCTALADNYRSALAHLLHEWEAATVKNLKIEGIWERTAFPLELQSTGA